MNSRSNSTELVLRHSERRDWYAFGLWLNVVVVGVGAMATGIALLLDSTYSPASTIVWLIGGGAVAVLAWRRSRTALLRLLDADEIAERTESTDNQHVGRRVPNAVANSVFGLAARG
jgi:hypothetical protein